MKQNKTKGNETNKTKQNKTIKETNEETNKETNVWIVLPDKWQWTLWPCPTGLENSHPPRWNSCETCLLVGSRKCPCSRSSRQVHRKHMNFLTKRKRTSKSNKFNRQIETTHDGWLWKNLVYYCFTLFVALYFKPSTVQVWFQKYTIYVFYKKMRQAFLCIPTYSQFFSSDMSADVLSGILSLSCALYT